IIATLRAACSGLASSHFFADSLGIGFGLPTAEQVASLLNVDSDEIVFTSGATESNNLALLGVTADVLLGQRRKVLMGSTDHKSVLALDEVLRRRGLAITTLPVDKDGHLDLDHLRKALRGDVLLASISVVNSEIGTVQQIETIGPILRQKGVLLH